MSASIRSCAFTGMSLMRRFHTFRALQKSFSNVNATKQTSSIRCFCSQADNIQEVYPEYDKSTEEFKYVERLLPHRTVPEPSAHSQYPSPSGWYPPKESVKSLPYFIRRTKNHMLPVYLKSINNLHMTVIKKVDGNIWEFEGEVRKFLENRTGRRILTQVHEIRRAVLIKGNYIPDVAEFLKEQGF